MALKKWDTGDTITERSANNKGVRKGLESDLVGITTADKEVGDVYYNEDTETQCLQSLYAVTGTKRIKRGAHTFANNPKCLSNALCFIL